MREGAALSLAVVGALHLNKDGSDRQEEIDQCAPGEPVTLRPEPDNPADAQAVAVFSSRGVQLGYVTAERAALIGGLIRSGRDYQAVFQAKAQFGAWIRLALDGAVPALPQPAGAQAEEHDDEFNQDWPGGDWPCEDELT